MIRPSARSVRRTAVDLTDHVGPHLAGAKEALVETVIPKARDAMVDTVLPKAKDAVGAGRGVMVDSVIPKAKEALPLAKGAGAKAKAAVPVAKGAVHKATEASPKAKAAGAALAAHAMESPRKRHRLRKVALLAALAAGGYAAWNAWRLPHSSDDWTQADATPAKVPTDTRTDAGIPGVPADTTRVTF